MVAITLRADLTRGLTNGEIDANMTNLKAAVEAAALSASWAGVTGKPTTVAGYGITDAQAPLVSGTNIKTVNNESVLGPGNLDLATKSYVDTAAVAAINAETAARAAADSAEVTARNNAITAETNRAVAAEATKANVGGGNASGTWPISVSGSAGSVPWSGVSGRPSGEPWFGTVSNCGGVAGAGYNTAISGGYALYDEGGNVRIGGTISLTNTACNCACSTCCFPLDTEVAMGDGSTKAVQDVAVGDKVLSPFGVDVEVLSQIICPVQEGEVTYLVNDTTRMTREHLLRGESGWLAVDLQGYTGWRVKQLSEGLDAGIDPAQLKQAEIGDLIRTLDGLVKIESIERIVGKVPETLMSLELTGSRSFFANGMAVESKTNQE